MFVNFYLALPVLLLVILEGVLLSLHPLGHGLDYTITFQVLHVAEVATNVIGITWGLQLLDLGQDVGISGPGLVDLGLPDVHPIAWTPISFQVRLNDSNWIKVESQPRLKVRVRCVEFWGAHFEKGLLRQEIVENMFFLDELVGKGW